MKRFIIEQCDEELYTVHTGLALVGLCLNRFTTIGEGDQAQTLQEGRDTQGTRGAGIQRQELQIHQGDQGDGADP